VKCGPCLAKPPVFRWLRSSIAYDDASRDLILGFKHADRLETLPLFARWLSIAVKDRLGDVDLLVPVPLHWRRLAMRRYNQAGLLAHGLGKLSGVPVHATALARTQATASQGEMVSARARLKNVARVFAVPDRQRPVVKGKSVAVVDDVLTTGATVSACGKALLRAGARDVSVITLARVVRPLNI
jgi:ComF family protein